MRDCGPKQEFSSCIAMRTCVSTASSSKGGHNDDYDDDGGGNGNGIPTAIAYKARVCCLNASIKQH